MIDASKFAAHHNAFWSYCAPTSEHYVRRINLEFVERWRSPLEKPVDNIRAAYVAEFAFSVFSARTLGLAESDINTHAINETKRRLLPLIDKPEILDDPISSSERQQIDHLESCMTSFFKYRMKRTVARPVFDGCGYIDTSEGDVISGNCLFEVKAVDRPFRSVDIRQLLTYCALNHMSRNFDLDNIGLFNPRRSLYFESGIDEVCQEIAGQSRSELLDEIVSVWIGVE